MTKNYSSNLNQRDRGILQFLWLWKVATTAALARCYYNDRAPATACKRLWELEACGYIESISDRRPNHHVWTLTKLGFQVVREVLPELRAEGFKSESITHDLITSAVHLGDFLMGSPQGVGLFTEQQLRRFDSEFYPDWIPRSDVHRPDGYWRVPVGNPWATIGLEVELFQKKTARYEVVADFYASYPSVIRILWIAASASMGRQIHDKIAAAIRGKAMVHDFVSLSNFSKLGWDAPIELGPERGKPIMMLLGQTSPSSPRFNGERILLDTRKNPFKSRVLVPVDQNSFRNRVG